MLPSSSLKQKNCFEYNLPGYWKTIPKCCICSNEYVVWGPKKSSRRPLILKCAHNVCDRCANFNHPTTLTCGICNTISVIERHHTIREVLEPNYFLMGVLNYKAYNLNYDIEFVDRHSTLENDKTSLQECSECNETLTNFFCVQCSVAYCKVCFDQVHKHGKVMQKHCLTKFDRRGTFNFINNVEKKCRVHNSSISRFCRDCKISICLNCITDGHQRHGISNILDENQRVMAKINSLIETVKSARETNKQAQKDAKFIEKRYERYASETIDKISEYFIYLHGVLQNIERKALFEVKNNVVSLLSRTQQTQTTLKKGLDTLEEVFSALQSTASHPPANVSIANLIEKANSILETTPCNIEFDGANGNPFTFLELKKRPIEFPNLFELSIDGNDFRPKIFTFFGDTSSLETENSQYSQKMAFPKKPRKINKPKIKRNKSNNFNLKTSRGYNWRTSSVNNSKESNSYIPKASISQNINAFSGPKLKAPSSSASLYEIDLEPAKLSNSQKVHVSHIKNPQHFYVQLPKYLATENEYQQCIANEADYAPTPDYIEENQLYLVLSPSKVWYRGLVVGTPSQDVYKLFLVDYGNCIQVPKQRFRTMSETLKMETYRAVKCSLYGINPIDENWTDKATQLMSEIISNELVNMVLIKENEKTQVDLITIHLNYPTSLRDALIFADLAIPDDNLPSDMMKRVVYMKKNYLIGSGERFYKHAFKEGESFRGVVLHVKDPHCFYAIKYDHKGMVDNWHEELNKEYQTSQQKLYTPQVNNPCAVCIEGNWYRGRIEDVFPKIYCTVWLVDKGKHEKVPSHQLRALLPKYLSLNECAFQCSLIDIETLQKNNYSWTSDAINDFKRVVQNPVLQIFIHRAKDFCYKIGLYIIKKDVDISVNALMVKYKHGNSTGPESQCVEYPKVKEYLKSTDDPISDVNLIENSIKEKPKTRANFRTKVKVCHIVSPGEFYINKIEHMNGIYKLHDEIQAACEKEEKSPKKSDDTDVEDLKDLKEGANCLTRLMINDDGIEQWYRAVITEITCTNGAFKYTVFLRDHGQTMDDISSDNIAPIPDLYNRVCNGAIKCHMACIQPTGGLSIWSGASIDEFKLAVSKFEELAGSIQGKRDKESIPIILWGLTRECSDPLAPTTFKWININKTLVNCGLVHLVDKFVTLTVENTFNSEPNDGQESLTEWLNNLIITVDKTIKSDKGDELRDSNEALELSETEEDIHEPISSWLPAQEINKTVFLGVPTYVDNDGIIYLHDTQQQRLLDNIRTVIQRKLTRDKGMIDSYWYAGQPCLAQYHLDNLFYRAIVLETKPDRMVSVQFIDYGNVEECSVKNLRKELVLTEIPIQVNKYKLDRVVPAGDKLVFSVDALDFVHANIVGKVCSIRTSYDQDGLEIKLCTIKCGSIDIAESMIQEGFGKAPGRNLISPLLSIISPKKRSKLPTTKIEAKIKKEISSDEDETGDREEDELVIGGTKFSHEKSLTDFGCEDYQKMFEKIDLDNLYNSIRVSSDGDSDADIIEIQSTYKPACCDDNLNENFVEDEAILLIPAEDTTQLSFDPKETSTDKSRIDIEPYRLMEIPENITEFKCEVTGIKNSTNLMVFPLLRDHKKRIVEMSSYIQTAAEKASFLKSYEPSTPCLAVYKEDKLWYRGILRSYKDEEKRADVLFVDFLNSEMVQCKRIRCIPLELVTIPLRNVQIKLTNLKPNPRWRDKDIQRKLAEIIDERKIYVKVITHGEILEVELYESENSTDLLYESMIAERFYLLNN